MSLKSDYAELEPPQVLLRSELQAWAGYAHRALGALSTLGDCHALGGVRARIVP